MKNGIEKEDKDEEDEEERSTKVNELKVPFCPGPRIVHCCILHATSLIFAFILSISLSEQKCLNFGTCPKNFIKYHLSQFGFGLATG